MTEQIRVAVQGALGRMGQEIIATLAKEPDMLPVGGMDKFATVDSLALPGGSGTIPISTSLADVIGDADVVVDFTNGEGAAAAIDIVPANGKHLVIGSTGIPDRRHRPGGEARHRAQCRHLHRPELHHRRSRHDAPRPGGSALLRLRRPLGDSSRGQDRRAVRYGSRHRRRSRRGEGGSFNAPAAEKELIAGTRGGDHEGVVIHSARMPGKVAHHEMVFGHVGQTLSIKHDSINRESFMPGVMLAIREIRNRPGLTIGLDKLMGL